MTQEFQPPSWLKQAFSSLDTVPLGPVPLHKSVGRPRLPPKVVAAAITRPSSPVIGRSPSTTVPDNFVSRVLLAASVASASAKSVAHISTTGPKAASPVASVAVVKRSGAAKRKRKDPTIHPNKSMDPWVLKGYLLAGNVQGWKSALKRGAVIDRPVCVGHPLVMFAFDVVLSPRYGGTLADWIEIVSAIHAVSPDLCTVTYSPWSYISDRPLNVLEDILTSYDTGNFVPTKDEEIPTYMRGKYNALPMILDHFAHHHPELVRSSVFPEHFLRTRLVDRLCTVLPNWRPLCGTYKNSKTKPVPVAWDPSAKPNAQL